MTADNDIPILTRPAFFSGQQLRAADLDSATSYHRELSWLHNRSLHNWGIATGCSATGLTGESQVVVGPGFALDCQGRELILTEQQVLAVPAVAGDAKGDPAVIFLTISWLDDEDIDAEVRAGSAAPPERYAGPRRWTCAGRTPTTASRAAPSGPASTSSWRACRCSAASWPPTSLARSGATRCLRRSPTSTRGRPRRVDHLEVWPDEKAPIGVSPW